MNERFLDKKWREFRRRANLFNHIPFVDFVMGAGSMAMGNPKEESDFDVIVGCRQGRIFTVRILSIFLFNVAGWRRNKYNSKDKNDSKDKICLNHFVTPESYRLTPPHNSYWVKLYQSLVPLVGRGEKIKEFFSKNEDWAGPIPKYTGGDLRNKSAVRWFLEKILSGRLGDYAEIKFKNYQIKRVERSMEKTPTFKPRIIYSDIELEFHPHTRRIEEMASVDSKE